MMDQLKKILAAIVPTAARMIGGPLAEMAVVEIGRAIGLEEPTAEKIAQAVTEGKLSAEQFRVKLTELGIKLEEVEAGDRKDARAMLVATGAKTPAVLSWVVVSATIVLEGWCLIVGLPEKADLVIVGRVLGTLDAAFVTVLSFWLGAAHQRAQVQRSSDTR
jgi:hypothetical protein